MLDFQQKWKMKTFMYSRGVLFVVFIVALYSIYSTYIVYQKKVDSAQSVADAEVKSMELSSKNTTLIKDIDRLQTDEGLEEEIRNKYSVAKEQEKVVILVEEKSSTTDDVVVKKSFISKLRDFFGL
ncbi:MAG: FtsB family cell division protein [Minisyncoccota bacterium]